jgi:type IV pilus assembly protein PilC
MIFSSKLSLSSMVSLCRQLATSIAAGIPILRSFEIIMNQTRNSRLRNVVSRMSESIRAGSSLEQAAREQSKHLPRFFTELVGAGEIGGRLDEMFESLAGYYERTLALAKQIRGRLIYPAAQLFMLWLVANFIFALGPPKPGSFPDFLEVLRTFARRIGYQSLIALLVLVVAIVLARMGILKWILGSISTFVWPLRPVVRKTALARFARSLSLLLKSGVPVTEAVRKAAATTDNPYIERSLLASVPAIQSGESLSVAFAECPYMSEMAREMLYTGEESGKVDQLLVKVADLHEAEAEHATQTLIKVTGILVLLAIAFIIGAFVIMFYKNLYGAVFKEFDAL